MPRSGKVFNGQVLAGIHQQRAALKGTSSPDAPTLTWSSATAGAVTLGWNKGGWTGVKFQGRTNGGGWVDLGVDLYSPFLDTRPLATPGQPENREYRACYLDGDTTLPGFSQVVEVTVTP